ncbi:MAG: maleylpyruvate isomerase family mycothiol-dependent enzyme [Cytophagales bacterium]|nr:maleylpyruvate isomerase family mycothiol-dependent enzyme [Cytophagales bacterium]
MIVTTHLFPVLDEHLIELLASLSPEAWSRPTLARLWTVKDVAAHLLDGNIRGLSLARDGHRMVPDREIGSYGDLVAYLNQLNADWTLATRRMSPNVLTGLLQTTGREYAEYLTTLDPHADAIFPVAWAGEHTSPNWFHVAREYTEKWHHQQQIREAVGKEGIMTRQLFQPFIDTFMRGLPHAYRHTAAPAGTVVRVVVDEGIGGTWYVVRGEDGWQLVPTPPGRSQATLVLPPGTAWKVFTKGITPEAALARATTEGDLALARVALSLVAVMA